MKSVDKLRALLEELANAHGGENSRTTCRITTAAAELFMERGYKHATMSDIAHRAGVVKATLYLHAERKSELLLMAIGAEQLAALELELPVLDPAHSPRERMMMYIQNLVTKAERCPLMHRLNAGDIEFRHALDELDPSRWAELENFGVSFHEALLSDLAPTRYSKRELKKRAKVLEMFGSMTTRLAEPTVRGAMSLNEVATLLSEIVVDGLAPREGATTQKKLKENTK